MEKEDLYVIEDYVVKVERNINIVKDHLSILELEGKQRTLIEDTLEMLESKLTLMKEAKNKKELKKVLRVKKLLGSDVR